MSNTHDELASAVDIDCNHTPRWLRRRVVAAALKHLPDVQTTMFRGQEWAAGSIYQNHEFRKEVGSIAMWFFWLAVQEILAALIRRWIEKHMRIKGEQ